MMRIKNHQKLPVNNFDCIKDTSQFNEDEFNEFNETITKKVIRMFSRS